MLSKAQLATVSEVFATASIVGVGWALGGTVGAAIMAGIGINLGSDIIQKGSTYLKEKWLSAEYGVLNHDIQRALARAFVQALVSLEARYFELAETNAQPREKKEAIRGLFKELRDVAPSVFADSVERIATEEEVRKYLYGNPQDATDTLWERVEGTKLLYTYYGEHFKSFVRDNINDELVFWFGEELKTDNHECNKAWRAFQRLLLEGIQADVKAVRASQEIIRQDLEVLDGIRTQLNKLQNTVDQRVAAEPFQQGLEESLNSMRGLLGTVAGTTQRTEIMVGLVVATTDRTEAKLDTVVAALSPGLSLGTPKLPADVQELFDEGLSLRVQGKSGEARSAFEKARAVAEKHGHALAIAKAKYYGAAMLNEWDHEPDAARAIVRECLREFRTEKSEIDVATGLFYLGTLELPIGNLDQARAYLSESLELSKKHQRKILIASALHQLGWLEHQRGNSKKALDQTEEALNLFLTVYQEGDAKSEKDAAHGVALCYHHKGLIHELWERVEGTKLLYTYYGEHFKQFLQDNLNDELVFLFGEELKTDNRECNKAWRAFQRLLLEGIQADVKALHVGQEFNHQDLQVLDGIRTQLDELKNTIDRRVDGEPFQQGLEQSLQSMRALLESVTGASNLRKSTYGDRCYRY
jgi:tetratricopeptide (TPR) repeat protein